MVRPSGERKYPCTGFGATRDRDRAPIDPIDVRRRERRRWLVLAAASATPATAFSLLIAAAR